MRFSAKTTRVVFLLLPVPLFNVDFTSTYAVPMTYAFNATVRPLPPYNGDVGLPFMLEEGSVIDGLITIDPSLGEPPFGNASKSVQPFDIELTFDGVTFGAETYSTTVINDSGIVDGPNQGPADFLVVGCSTGSFTACLDNPLAFPSSPPLLFAMTMQFSGDVNLLQAPELPNDINVWNGFDIERSMRISFATPTGEGAVFRTTLSDFTPVPEPSTITLIVFSCITILPIRIHSLSAAHCA